MGKEGKEKKKALEGSASGGSEGGKSLPPSNLPPALQNEAGPLTTFDPDLGGKDLGVPSVSQPGIVYQLRPFTGFGTFAEGEEQSKKGMAVSRPFLITSVDSNNQRCNGYVFLEPGDVTPSNGSSIGSTIVYVENIPHGGPGQPDTWHYVSKGYTGKITLPKKPVDPSQETTHTQEIQEIQEVTEGN